MLIFSLKNIWAYKKRFLLSLLSVVLGVTFLCGTLVFSDTIKQGFNDLFTSIFTKTDAVIRPVADRSSGPNATISSKGVSQDLLEKIQSMDDVRAAEGFIQIPHLVVIDQEGKPAFASMGPPTMGFSFSTNPDLTLYSVIGNNSQSLPQTDLINLIPNDDEVYVDKGTADLKRYTIGDPVKVVLPDSVREYKIKGFIRFGSADSLGGAATFFFNMQQARNISGMKDSYSYIDISARNGVTQQKLEQQLTTVTKSYMKEHQGSLPLEVITGDKLTKEAQGSAQKVLDVFKYILLGFAFIAFVVALVMIINSFAIVLAQRKREYALLRAIGAKPTQIWFSVIFEALIIGIVASIIGVIGGSSLAKGIIAFMGSHGMKFPHTNLTVQPYVIVVGVCVGMVATIGSAFFPAFFASRVAPIEALREAAYEKNRRWLWRILFIVFIGILASLTITYSFTLQSEDRIKLMGLGIFLLFVATIGLLPLLVRPFTAVVGSRIMGVFLFIFGGRRAFGVTGDIARRNNYRNPRRTARTALALFIGVFLVSFFTVVASSTAASMDKFFSKNFSGDLIIGNYSPTPALTMSRCEEIYKLSVVKNGSCIASFLLGVDTHSPEHNLSAKESPTSVDIIHSDEITSIAMNKFQGTLDGLGDDGIAISRQYATREHLKLNDTITLLGAQGKGNFYIKAILEEPIVFTRGTLLIDFDGFHRLEEPTSASIAVVTLKDGVSVEQGQKAIEKVLANTGIEVSDQKSLRDYQISQMNNVVNIIYGLLGLAIIIAGIGIVNTMSLSILERQRELGLMRALGVTKSQVRGFVRFESVIVAVMGTLLGIISGTFAVFFLIQSVKDEGLDTFCIEPIRLVIIILLSALIGVCAGAWPAWRATKVDVLKAITVE